MARPIGATTLTISSDDDAELEELCADYEGAYKTWLGGVLLRYGMRHVEDAMKELSDAASQRVNLRRTKRS